MIRTYLNRFIFTLAVALGVAACANSQAQKPANAGASPARSADAYAAEALATFELQRDGARSLNLINEAVKQAPNRADLAYLQASLCARMDGCSPEPYDARLRKLDPKNAIVWMRALATAQRQRDAAAEAQILDALGRSERFDVYWNPLVANLTLARAPTQQRSEAVLSETIRWLSATIIPEFQPLTLGCSRGRTGDPQWAERCRRASRVLMNADTFLAESVGIALARQVTAEPTEIAKLDERARTAGYLWRTAADLIAAQIERDKFAVEQVKLMKKLRREQDMHLAIVRWSGRPVVPPADFKLEE